MTISELGKLVETMIKEHGGDTDVYFCKEYKDKIGFCAASIKSISYAFGVLWIEEDKKKDKDEQN